MKLSKAYILQQLEDKTAEEIATEIVTKQAEIYHANMPTGYIVDIDASIKKYIRIINSVKGSMQ